MQLTFLIDYYAHLGERLALHLTLTTNETQVHRILPLTTDDHHTWEGSIIVESKKAKLSYTYAVYDGEVVVREETVGHTLHLNDQSEAYCIRDLWCDTTLPAVYQSSALHKVVYGHKRSTLHDTKHHITLRVTSLPHEGYHLAIVGSSDTLGNWNPEKAVPLQRIGAYEWGGSIPLTASVLTSEYKYIWRNDIHLNEVVWEEGDNRIFLPYHKHQSAAYTLVVSDGFIRLTQQLWRGAGMVLPLFSIRTEHTFGVGDMTSLSELVRWCSTLGMSVLQLLPINDTTDVGHWRESYPYNGVSVFALHPMYLDIMAMGKLSVSMAKDYHDTQQVLNALDAVDYEAVNHHKWRFIRWQYQKNKGRVCSSESFKTFCRDNEAWLPQYAYFCYFRDLYHTANFRDWPRFATYDKEALAEYFKEDPTAQDELLLHYYVQYELHRQLSSTKAIAQELGVILKGDIPIGICRNSDSAWYCPELFNFDGQAGAPPDDFATDGQNWGFPTYNWPQHAKTDYIWWRQRFEQLATYFDAYRIDHVLGFFRIWEIPYGTRSGLLGQFSPALGMTEMEMSAFGFILDRSKHLIPHVSPEALALHVETDILQEVISTCFDLDDSATYTFKKTLPNQSALLTLMRDKVHWSTPTQDFLLSLYTEVLFVCDKTEPSCVHPRIQGDKTALFQNLSPQQQEAYRRLYHHYYYQRNDTLWQQEALSKLGTLISSSSLLPCAEDLGMLPNGVRDTLNVLGLLSLEIQTMPKSPHVRFADTTTYPYLSVATFATHDMPPLRTWWQECPEEAQLFWHKALHREGIAPCEATKDVCEQVVLQHLNSPSMLCLLAFQDWLSIDADLRIEDSTHEQINVPSNPNHYWRYRMHLTIEYLTEQEAYTQRIRKLIKSSGR